MQFKESKKVLNQLVADISQMTMVVHQTHWYMRGPNFLKLHPLLDDWMDDLNDQLDIISERLIALDGSPYSTLAEMAEHSKIPAEKGDWNKTIDERFEQLSQDYRYLADLYQHGIEVTDAEKDLGTQDILIGYKTETEKRLWMLNAELGKKPGNDE